MTRKTFSSLAILALLTTATPANAGDERGDGWTPGSLDVGGFVVVSPKYEGSKDYKVMGFPIILPPSSGRPNDGLVQFRGIDDIRLRVFTHSGFEMGPLAGWRFGRDEDDSNRLVGLGDVDGGLILGGYLGYRAGAFMPYVSYHRQITGDDTGALVRVGIETSRTISPSLSLRANTGVNIADNDYADAFFSVSGAQSAASVAGLRAYDAGAGIKDVFVGLTADVQLSDSWTLKLSGRYARLVGDAADSPIVESENQFTAGVGLTYRFNMRR